MKFSEALKVGKMCIYTSIYIPLVGLLIGLPILLKRSVWAQTPVALVNGPLLETLSHFRAIVVSATVDVQGRPAMHCHQFAECCGTLALTSLGLIILLIFRQMFVNGYSCNLSMQELPGFSVRLTSQIINSPRGMSQIPNVVAALTKLLISRIPNFPKEQHLRKYKLVYNYNLFTVKIWHYKWKLMSFEGATAFPGGRIHPL